MPFYYAVAKGRLEGVFTNWAECEKQVKGFKGAVFKKFKSKSEAEKFIITHRDNLEKGQEGLAQTLAQISNSSVQIKQEFPDFIPLEISITPNNEVKQEALDESLFFEDKEGDKDLMNALSVLQEYPDPNEIKPDKDPKQKTRPARQTQRIEVGRFTFDADANGYVDVYIGGHGENIGNWNCSAGYGVYFGHDHPLNVAEAASGRMTRNVGEIEAAIKAIEIAKQNSVEKLCMHTTSEFLLNAVKFWMKHWKLNGWRNRSGKVVQNRKQFECLDKLLSEGIVDVEWYDARRNPGASRQMRGATNLAKIGTEEYIEQHPSKDETFHEFDYFY